MLWKFAVGPGIGSLEYLQWYQTLSFKSRIQCRIKSYRWDVCNVLICEVKKNDDEF